MRYLKMFEDVNMYQEITQSEFFDFYYGTDKYRFSGFDKNEVIFFNKRDFVYDNDEVPDEEDDYGYHGSKDNPIAFYMLKSFQTLTGNTRLIVYKDNDSWYYVEFYNNRCPSRGFFKCDQWDGLISCLKNEFNI